MNIKKLLVLALSGFSSIAMPMQDPADNFLEHVKMQLLSVQSYYQLSLRQPPKAESRSLSGAGALEDLLKQKQLLLFIAQDGNALLVKKCHKKYFEELTIYDREVFFFADHTFDSLKSFIEKTLSDVTDC